MKKLLTALLTVAMILALIPILGSVPAVAETPDVFTAFVQVAHLAPFAEDTSVTVGLSGVPILYDFSYGDSTGYIGIRPGTHEVEIVPTGTTTVAISSTINILDGAYYTLVVFGDGDNQSLELLLLEDDLTPPTAGHFKIRLGHLAPFAPGLATADVRLADDTPILENLNFGDVSGYLELPAGTYDINITTPGGGTILINLAPVDLEAGAILSAFVAGDGVNEDLGVFALPAGEEGFFLPLQWFYYLPIITKVSTP